MRTGNLFSRGGGNTVIDYVMGSEEVREKLAATRVGDRMESDHHPLEVRIGNDGERSGREGGEGRRWERSIRRDAKGSGKRWEDCKGRDGQRWKRR